MNKITEALSKIFNENQIQAMKDCWRFGAWGDSEVNFAEENDEWGLGACSNDIKYGGHFSGRQISGIISGISKKIDESGTNMVAYFPNWWGDGTGDMMFFNYHALGFKNSTNGLKALNDWSKSDD